jgi:hypothetical protein
VSVAAVGPGGSGVLRAAFDAGRGGWFGIVRIADAGASRPAAGAFDVQIVSEALTREEEPHRFTIAVAPPA